MLKAEFAELILSTTLPPGPAASVTGDLEEESRTRGYLWFWITLLRTAAAASWRVFAEAPFLMIFWALAGLAGQFLCWLAISGSLVLIMAPMEAGRLDALSPAFRMAVASRGRDISLILTTVGVAFLFGKWLARKVPYRELPVYAIASVLSLVFFRLLTIWIAFPVNNRVSWIVGALCAAIGPIFTLAGIKRGRALAHKT